MPPWSVGAPCLDMWWQGWPGGCRCCVSVLTAAGLRCRLASTLSSMDALKPPKAPKLPPRVEGGGSGKDGEAAGGEGDEEEEEEKTFFQKYVRPGLGRTASSTWTTGVHDHKA